jgi:hypothetical protein
MNYRSFRYFYTATFIAGTVLFSGCDDDELKKEDTPELITKATLTFTPSDGGSAIVVTATDPDAEGVQDITADGPVNLEANKTYVLTLELINELVDPSHASYYVSDEVEEEGDEHMFFFSWTNEVFSDPSGDGNIDSRSDAVNYTGGANSVDASNLPLGLTTTWTSASTPKSGNLRILLKHQPELKSATSDSNTGETDLDLTFTVNVF